MLVAYGYYLSPCRCRCLGLAHKYNGSRNLDTRPGNERKPDLMKKAYTSAFKTQVVLGLLKEEKTLAQLSSDHGIHVNVLRDWKVVALKGIPTLFDRRDTLADQTD